MTRLLTALGVALFFPLCADWEMRVDQTELPPGEPFQWELTLPASASGPAGTALFADSPFYGSGSPRVDSGAGGTRVTYRLAADLPGTFPLPSLSLRGTDGRSPKSIGGLVVRVEDRVDGGRDMKAAPIEEILRIDRRPLYVIIGAAALLVLALTVFFLLRRYLGRRRVDLPAVPPAEEAGEELARLRPLIERDDRVQELYYGLSFCLRRFLSRSLDLFILESSTEEVGRILERVGYSPRRRERILETLAALDRVKYALAGAGVEERRDMMRQAEALIAENDVMKEERG